MSDFLSRTTRQTRAALASASIAAICVSAYAIQDSSTETIRISAIDLTFAYEMLPAGLAIAIGYLIVSYVFRYYRDYAN